MLLASVLGVMFGLGFVLVSESEIIEASELFKTEWTRALIFISVAVAISCVLSIKKVRNQVRNRFSGRYNQFLFLMAFLVGFGSVWIGLTIVVTTYIRFHTFEFSHFGFHAIVTGTIITIISIPLNIYQQSTQ